MQWGVDFIAASVSGFFGLAVSYPLDIIKCRMQLEFREYRNIKSAFYKIFKEEKIFGLYKGFSAPCINIIPINAITFSEYFRFLRLIDKHFKNLYRGVKQYLAGMCSGVVAVTICTPFEHLKIKIQADKTKFNSFRAMARQIYQSDGIKGLYKGYAVTMNRDFYSFGAYFYIYYGLKEHWEDKNSLTNFKMFVAGGLAGVISWIICYPFDPMKTIIQRETRKLSQREAYEIIKLREGWIGFFRGMSPVLTKAFVQHGTVFFTTDILRKMLNER